MRIAIIGGSGGMGQWFARFLSHEGNEITITGRNKAKLEQVRQQLDVSATTDNVEATRNADAVLVSVPIDYFEDIIKEISPYTRSGQFIMDVTSIKVSPVATMHKYIKKGLVLGTHPMFGPGALSLKNQSFVLTPVDEAEKALAQKVKGYLETRGGIVSITSPDEHDKMMAFVLGLSHFIAIVSADTLLNFSKREQARAAAGTTYKVLLTLIEGVISRDPEFYASLQMYLPDMVRVQELFQRSAKTWADLVKAKDKNEFVRRMSSLRDKLGKDNPELENAYDNMYKLMHES